ncbi:MAG TPA: hypothetical protein VH593_14370 [Ktedonobacteraceae bacterium]|jgi:hypothetical protein
MLELALIATGFVALCGIAWFCKLCVELHSFSYARIYAHAEIAAMMQWRVAFTVALFRRLSNSTRGE